MTRPDLSDLQHIEPRLLQETFVRRVEFRAEVGSTNDLALRLAADADFVSPLLVLAARQTGGRGRGGNRWWSAAGGLTFSLVLSGDDLSLDGREWPKVALATGLAVCEAVAPLAGPDRVRLKWPNDVLVDGRKLCGILVETAAPPAGRVVIGVGINVNNPLRDAPPELRARGTSLIDATGQAHDRGDVLVRFLRCFERELGQLRAADWADRWQARCALRGGVVEIETAGRRLTGVCRGVDVDGALLLHTESGLQRIISGVVVRWGGGIDTGVPP